MLVLINPFDETHAYEHQVLSSSLQVFTEVTELFIVSSKPRSKNGDCARYIDYLTEIDAHKMRFIECLRQELVKVDIFYSKKTVWTRSAVEFSGWVDTK